MLKVNNKDTSSGVFIINFEHFTPCSSVSIVNFKQLNAGWKKLSSFHLLVQSQQSKH